MLLLLFFFTQSVCVHLFMCIKWKRYEIRAQLKRMNLFGIHIMIKCSNNLVQWQQIVIGYLRITIRVVQSCEWWERNREKVCGANERTWEMEGWKEGWRGGSGMDAVVRKRHNVKWNKIIFGSIQWPVCTCFGFHIYVYVCDRVCAT